MHMEAKGLHYRDVSFSDLEIGRKERISIILTKTLLLNVQ
jgi:hypothetical protein